MEEEARLEPDPNIGGGVIWIPMRYITDGEIYQLNYIKRTEPNNTLSYAPGTEHHHSITSTLWGHRGLFDIDRILVSIEGNTNGLTLEVS